MANCVTCGTVTNDVCTFCHKPACEEHIYEIAGAMLCRPCYKETPEYLEYRMRKVEQGKGKKKKK